MIDAWLKVELLLTLGPFTTPEQYLEKAYLPVQSVLPPEKCSLVLTALNARKWQETEPELFPNVVNAVGPLFSSGKELIQLLESCKIQTSLYFETIGGIEPCHITKWNSVVDQVIRISKRYVM